MTQGPLGPVGRGAGIQGRKYADQVASRLRMMIARGDLKEGDWLPTEAELTEQFGVSRPTLREAFRLLEGDGLVTIRRGPPGGARVTLPGPEQASRLFGLILTLSGTTLKDVFEARTIIEVPIVRSLASRATADDIARLRAAIDEAEALSHDDEVFAGATTAFHQLLVSLGGNVTLSSVTTMLSEITTRHLILASRELRRRDRTDAKVRNAKAIRVYRKLVDLIESGDAEATEKLWQRHMEQVLVLLEEQSAAAESVIDVLD